MSTRDQRLTPDLRHDLAHQVDELLWTTRWTMRPVADDLPRTILLLGSAVAGAGSNRRPSDFSQVHLIGVRLPGIVLAVVACKGARSTRSAGVIGQFMDT